MILTLLTPAPAWASSLPPSPMVHTYRSDVFLLRPLSSSSLDVRGAARLLLSKLHLLAGDWPPVCLS
ncbi:unnamed protein product [Staurois parvus]|uniref:Secreted protein n=1 Tax=Staurois parvus TaxID=386267 RepID=A0ABN9DGL6_9NEOB|nr:unnamed protein product [Staurois parvus]